MKTILAVLMFATLAVAQNETNFTKALPVSNQAQLKIESERQEARVSEAKDLLLEKERLEKRLGEISQRLKELDGGSDAKPSAKVCLPNLSCIYTDSTTSSRLITR